MHHLRWLVLVFAPLVLLGCREEVRTRAYDAGLVCGQNERIVDGECKFVCDRDSDCADGERCNLFLGTCEPKPPQMDAGVALFPCTSGAVRCRSDSKAVEKCDADGEWIIEETCAADGFCANETCLACQPGATRCDSQNAGIVQLCPDDGSGWQTLTCATSASCVQGECRECAPGSSQCSPDNTSLQSCTKTEDQTKTWAWANAGDHFDGSCITKQCVAGNPPMCKAPDCIPGATRCASAAVQELCSQTGAWTPQTCTSIPGLGPSAECKGGICVDECAEAAKQKSYFGCEYWTAVQDNGVDRFFKNMPSHTNLMQGTTDSDFAFAISNRSDLAATVNIYRFINGAETLVKTVNVPGRTDPATKGLAVAKVPWQSIGYTNKDNPNDSITGRARFAYRITSTRPITMYQFSPLDAVRITKTCSGFEGNPDSTCNELPDYSGGFFGDPNTWGVCKTGTTGKRCHYYTFSNDASLLLPSHILGTSHVAVSLEHSATGAPSSFTSQITGHVTIVATQNNTQVTFKSSAVTRASPSNYTPAVPALAKGQTATYTLNQYEVLQLSTWYGGTSVECSGGICRYDNDLTGSVITSDKPVAVFGGAACALKPYDKGFCDHLEEQIFPFATWGKTFVAQKGNPVRLTNGQIATLSQAAPDHFKIVASCPASQCPNGTLITFSNAPAAADVLPPNRCISGTLATNNCRLAGGSHMEFKSKANFTITADQPIAVAQFFAGQSATTNAETGDPSFILLPPAEQWRSDYTVLTAPGIRDNYLGLVIDSAKVQSVEVDGVVVTGFTPVGTTTYQAKNHPVSVGVHTIKVNGIPGNTQLPSAGVIVYGFDSYVSYGYTGGLDLGSIVTGIDPGG